MRVIDILIGILWVSFWIYWLIAALLTRTRGSLRQSRVSIIVRVGILLIVLLVIRTRVVTHLAGAITNPFLLGIGFALFVMGLGLAVWARMYLGSNWGVPMSRRAHGELITSGPYRAVRHPIYSGIILAMLGSALAESLYWLAGLVVLGGYFIYSATVEERNMTERFPDTYPRYRETTKMLIPFLL